MKKFCYTVITNGYDTLKEPWVVTEGWRYVCFTDDISLKSDVWEIIPYTAHNRRVKILGHEYFNGMTIYVDGNITIKMNLNLLIQNVPSVFTTLKHPRRNCIYDELNYLLEKGRADACTVMDQCERYKRDSFPVGYGLGEHRVLIRDFGSEQEREVCEMWWKEFQMGVQRDQVCLSYCLWKMDMIVHYINRPIWRKYFKKSKHL